MDKQTEQQMRRLRREVLGLRLAARALACGKAKSDADRVNAGQLAIRRLEADYPVEIQRA